VTAPGALWRPAYVGIGSNLGDPVRQVQDAFDALEQLPESGAFARSGLWCSAPIGPENQPDYVNAVAAFVTQLQPADLLRRLQAIEQAAGRQPQAERWGPRTLDLDLLVLGRLVFDEPALTLPHPRIAERNFVLLPLAEIAPSLNVPRQGTVARLLGGVSRTHPRIQEIATENPA
jgi:2-amino-4-hydroxy-6-hydroxymethyldihydropteridine diphosphokinase